ncbi:MAG: metalloprotease, partial [Candidatus Woesearchaeota archaeon]
GQPQFMQFSKTEIQHIARAWAAITLAFAIMSSGGNLFSSTFLFALFVSAITVGTGFVAHELCHKYLAQRYGFISEFRAFDQYLVLAIIMSFFGFIFAAPGAVFIAGRIDRVRNGRISAAGPLANIVMAAVFLALAFVPVQIIQIIAVSGLTINAWLAFFNMLPFGNFDGAKIFAWNKMVYAFLAAAALILLVIPSVLATKTF